ncbi:MAG TPA: ATP-grasp domain-containing protein [Acidimicrobiales bacterium]
MASQTDLSSAKRALLERRLRQSGSSSLLETSVPTTGPLVVVGYPRALQESFDGIQPLRSVVYVEEPDVAVGGRARTHLSSSVSVRELIEFEYQQPGAADAFVRTHPDLHPSAVLPGIEYAVPFAARLAEHYRVPGAGARAADTLRDKATLRVVTAAAGITNPRSRAVDGPDGVRRFMAEQGGPIVLKPANRQGAVGTMILDEPDQIDGAWAACTVHDEGPTVPRRGLPLRMLAEQYVRGEEFSVEMLVRDGAAIFASVTAKALYAGPRPIEQGHVVPADVADDQRHRLIEETARVVTAVDFGTGFIHCEWIVSDGTPYLVECAGRLPGDGIVELIEKAWELEIVRIYTTVMKGQPVHDVIPGRPRRGAAVWFLDVPAGRVTAVHGVERAQALPGVERVGVKATVGCDVNELRSSTDRAAFVLASGDDGAEALRTAQRGIEAITITIAGMHDGGRRR